MDLAPPSPIPPPGPLVRALDRVDEGRLLRLALGLSLAFTVAAALSSDSVFQIDEHFQVVEFAGERLGRTPAASLAWEHAARIRPWMQPAALVGIARVLGATGVDDPFVLLRAFRLASGLLSWVALASLLLAIRAFLPSARWRRVATLSLALPYFVPYLAARLSSESGATTFLVLALAAVLPLAGASTGAPPPAPSWKRLVAAGLALGLAFEMRFQAGIAVAGLLLWLLVHARDRLRILAPILLGLAPPLLAGLAVDAWGYGSFELVPWRYFAANLLEGKAADFGTSPFLAYTWFLAGLFPPFGLALLLGMLLFWWRFPRHLLTWITLPFVLVHSAIGHKEIRFLFPILPAATLCVVVLLSVDPSARTWLRRGTAAVGFLWLGRVTWAWNAVALLLLCLLPSSDNLELQRYFHRHAAEPARWVALTDPRTLHGQVVPFVAPRPMPAVEVVRDAASLEAALSSGPMPVLVAARYPLPPGAEAILERRGTRVFVSLPSWLERVNFFGWLGRADMTYVWRVEGAAPRRGRRSHVAPGSRRRYAPRTPWKTSTATPSA